MKIQDIIKESENENRSVDKSPSPGDTGSNISTAQAAKILNVSMSRVRQLIMNGKLPSKKPVAGRRDNSLKLQTVLRLKKQKQKKRSKKKKS